MENYSMDAKCKYTINDKADIKSVIEYLVRDVKATHVLSEAKEFEVKLVMNELLSNCFKYCKICPEAPVIVEYRVKDKLRRKRPGSFFGRSADQCTDIQRRRQSSDGRDGFDINEVEF